MQLLERKDKQKWYVWIAQGIQHESDLQDNEEVDTSNLNTKIEEYFNRQQA